MSLANGPTSNAVVSLMNFGIIAGRRLVQRSNDALRRGCVLLPALCIFTSLAVHASAGEEAQPARTPPYRNEKIAEGPWSVHIVRMDLRNPEYELHSMLADGVITGMTTLSEQVKAVSAGLGRPIAAVNGDFYETGSKPYRGDPRGLQIVNGELVSGLSEYACFWMDPAGNPHTDIVKSFFRVIWADGTGTPFGLNEERPDDGAVLYTTTMGSSTGTQAGGREIILEPVEKEKGLPLRVGAKFEARVQRVQDVGDSPLRPGQMVISLGRRMLVDAPAVKEGDIVQISTRTLPDLTGCRTAIGGGPRLVVDSKPVGGWKAATQRHPRTAIGWNKDSLYLILVDGRQPGLSVGMSFQELAAYFIKLGCTTAMNLDGGGSASMWAFGQVVSNPSEGQERPIANGLVLVKKPKP
jgi:Phosphodiester glycosidase